MAPLWKSPAMGVSMLELFFDLVLVLERRAEIS